MTGLTRSDSSTRVHNGRICHPVTTLLAEEAKLTHRLSLALKAESMKPLPSKLNSAHMRFPLSSSHWVWFRTELFHNNFGFDLPTPVDSTVFPMTQRI